MSATIIDRPANAGARYDLADFVTPQLLTQVTGQRYDAAQTALTLRALTEVFSRTFDVKYPDLKIRDILPIYTGVDPAADGFVWRSFDVSGAAQIIDSYAADLPSVETFATENMSRCYSLGVSYNYSIQDLRAATFSGVPLETRKAFMARRAMEQAVEQIGFFGGVQIPGSTFQSLKNAPAAQSTTDNLQMYGLTNFPGLPIAMNANDWTNPATAVQTIVDDWNTNVNAMMTTTKGVHQVNCVVFPLSLWKVLNTRARSVTFTDDTVLSYLLRLQPMIKNVYWTVMTETAGKKQDTVTAGPRIIFMERNDENMQLVLPGGFEQLPPQMVNLTFKIPCHQRVAGVRVSYPLAFRALDGCAG